MHQNDSTHHLHSVHDPRREVAQAASEVHPMNKRIVWRILSECGVVTAPRTEIDPQSYYVMDINNLSGVYGFDTESAAVMALQEWFKTHGRHNGDEWVLITMWRNTP